MSLPVSSIGHDIVEEMKNVKNSYSVSYKETAFTGWYVKKELT
jgi:hypothetical protein